MVLTAQQWLEHVRQFEASGFTQREYAQFHSLNLHTFRGQLYRVRRRLQDRDNEPELRLVPVRLQVEDQASQLPILQLQLGDFKLLFNSLPDPRYLARIMRALIDQEA